MKKIVNFGWFVCLLQRTWMNTLRIFTSVLFRPVSHALWTFLIAFIVSSFFFLSKLWLLKKRTLALMDKVTGNLLASWVRWCWERLTDITDNTTVARKHPERCEKSPRVHGISVSSFCLIVDWQASQVCRNTLVTFSNSMIHWQFKSWK